MRLSGLQWCKQFGQCNEIFLLSNIKMDGIIGRTSIIQFIPLWAVTLVTLYNMPCQVPNIKKTNLRVTKSRSTSRQIMTWYSCRQMKWPVTSFFNTQTDGCCDAAVAPWKLGLSQCLVTSCLFVWNDDWAERGQSFPGSWLSIMSCLVWNDDCIESGQSLPGT